MAGLVVFYLIPMSFIFDNFDLLFTCLFLILMCTVGGLILLSVLLQVCLSVLLQVCLSVLLQVCLSVCVASGVFCCQCCFRCVCLCVFLSVCVSFCLSVCLCLVCLSVGRSVDVSAGLPACLPACVRARIHVCVCVHRRRAHTLLSVLLQPKMEAVLVRLLIWRQDSGFVEIVRTNLAAHHERSRKTALIFCSSLAFILFAGAMFSLQVTSRVKTSMKRRANGYPLSLNQGC